MRKQINFRKNERDGYKDVMIILSINNQFKIFSTFSQGACNAKFCSRRVMDNAMSGDFV